MTDLFPPWHLFSAFLIASFILAVTPGPSVIYIVTRSLVQGQLSGLMSVAGVALGNLCNAMAASIGLAALFAVSSLAFSIIKYAGAVYLVYLGIQMMRSPLSKEAVSAISPLSRTRIFQEGFVVAFLNPKTTIFFAAFLPQFISQGDPVIFQSVMLGAIFVLMAAFTDSLYALAASAAEPLIHNGFTRHIGRYIGGGIFVGLGVFTALVDSRTAK